MLYNAHERACEVLKISKPARKIRIGRSPGRSPVRSPDSRRSPGRSPNRYKSPPREQLKKITELSVGQDTSSQSTLRSHASPTRFRLNPDTNKFEEIKESDNGPPKDPYKEAIKAEKRRYNRRLADE